MGRRFDGGDCRGETGGVPPYHLNHADSTLEELKTAKLRDSLLDLCATEL